jgi:hypothetical protein
MNQEPKTRRWTLFSDGFISNGPIVYEELEVVPSADYEKLEKLLAEKDADIAELKRDLLVFKTNRDPIPLKDIGSWRDEYLEMKEIAEKFEDEISGLKAALEQRDLDHAGMKSVATGYAEGMFTAAQDLANIHDKYDALKAACAGLINDISFITDQMNPECRCEPENNFQCYGCSCRRFAREALQKFRAMERGDE